MQKLIKLLELRYKAAVGALGAVLAFLYQLEAVRPNHYLEAVILVLLVVGVHQVPNKVGVAPEAPVTPPEPPVAPQV